MKKFQKIVVLAGLIAASLAVTAQSASAWWCGPCWGARAWCGPRCFAPACCAPCWDPCFTCCDVCTTCDVCAPVAAAPVACAEPCCGPVCSSSYVLGWRPGPIRRLLFGRYRWYPIGYSSYGVAYGADCCGGSSEVIEEAPAAAPTNAAPAPAPASEAKPSVVEPAPTNSSVLEQPTYHKVSYAPAETQLAPIPENSALLRIAVPMDAVVYVNDAKTSTEGTSRSFVSFGLQAGNEYDYVVRAEVVRNGLKYVETRVVTLTAGMRESVTLPFDALNKQVVAF